MMDKKKKINANGFILADVVLGMLILVVALLAIAGVYIQSNKSNIFADNRTVAYNWAQERMEYLKANSDWRGNSLEGSPPNNPKDTGNDSPPRKGFKRDTNPVCPTDITVFPNTADTIKTTINNRLIDTTVTVTWTENGIDQSVSLRTLIDRQ